MSSNKTSNKTSNTTSDKTSDNDERNDKKSINKMINLLKTKYINQHNLADLDTNPDHFITDYQYAVYVDNVLATGIDPHFYSINIINHNDPLFGMFNKYGYICLDIHIMNTNSLESVLGQFSNPKIVLDGRGLSTSKYDFTEIVGMLCHFNVCKSKVLKMDTVLEYKDRHGEITYKIFQQNGILKIYNYEKRKETKMFDISKIPSYDTEELVFITQFNNITSFLFNKLGVPVYNNNEDTNINFKSYRYVDIMGYKVLLPSETIVNDHFYKISGPIKEEYYPVK